MKESTKISRKTKSTAYRFIKSLMKDGVEGEDIHKLVAAISDNVNKEVGGEILADLIRNSKDENGDVKHETHWFGPISVQYYNWVIESWSTYCKDTDLRGIFRFGDLDDWEAWNKVGSHNCTKEELKDRTTKSTSQICCFEWWADSVTSVSVVSHLNELFDNLKERIEEEEEEK